ncbi:MAG: hypothetical protein WC516_00970 [Patescibacteria group bacterium]
MEKVKSFFGQENKLAKIVSSALILAALALIFGPGALAQFTRQTGDVGWGYGYGYGYGIGHGFDSGSSFGYKADEFDTASTTLGYGFGYGYNDGTFSGGQYVNSALEDLVNAGAIESIGSDISSTTSLTFKYPLFVDMSTVTFTIPADTSFTTADGSKTDFYGLTAAASGIVTTGLPSGYSSVGAVQFGLPSLGLTLNQPMTISITVGTGYNGQSLTVYHKTPGGNWDYLTSCTVSAGLCTFTTTELSEFASAVGSSSGTGGSSGGGSYSAPVTYCTSVSYTDWGSCVNGIKTRGISSQSPAACSLTSSQSLALRQTCDSSAVNGPAVTTKPYKNGSKLAFNGKCYLVTNNMLKATVKSVCYSSKYNSKTKKTTYTLKKGINEVTAAVLAAYPSYRAPGTLLRATGTKKIYLVQTDGSVKYVSTMTEYKKLLKKAKKLTIVSAAVLATFPVK